MKIFLAVFSFLSPVLLFAGPQPVKGLRANMPALCKAGSVTTPYLGKYYVSLGNEERINLFVEKNQVNINYNNENIIIPLRSCVLQGIRVVTLIDPQNSSSAYNFASFVSLESRQVMLNEINEVPLKGGLTLQDIILKSSGESLNVVLQGTK